MNDFFQSKFVKDLGEGKLPPVVVEVDNISIVKLVAAGLLLLTVWYVLRKNVK